MNFILNLLAIIVSVAALAVFGLIILVVAVILYGINDNLRKSIEEIDQPQPVLPPAVITESMEVQMDNVIHAIKIIHDEDSGWRALRMINRYVAEFSDHPDIYSQEQELRRMFAERLEGVFA